MSLTVLLLFFIGWCCGQKIEDDSAYYVDSKKTDVCQTKSPFVNSYNADSYVVSEFGVTSRGSKKKNKPKTVGIITCAEEEPILFFTYDNRLDNCIQKPFEKQSSGSKWYLPHIHCDASYWLAEAELSKPFDKEDNMIVIGGNAPFVFSTEIGGILSKSGHLDMLIVTIIVGFLCFVGAIFAWLTLILH